MTLTIDDLRNWRNAAAEASPPVRLGVIGDPVSHSFSPEMQNAALAAAGLPVRYGKFQIGPADLAAALRLFCEHDFIGLNLTIPHKLAALDLVDDLDPVARQIGAMNTIVFGKNGSLGCNTDAAGFARAIRETFSVDLRDLRVLILGAGGGAGRAIAWQCAMERCERLVLVNRTLDTVQRFAEELAVSFSGPRVFGPEQRLAVLAWDNRLLRSQLARTDLVVNATPLGLSPSDPSPLPHYLLEPHLMVYDLIYGPTRFLAEAAEAGARGADGSSMLLHQGALAFELWFNRPAPVEVMRSALHSAGR